MIDEMIAWCWIGPPLARVSDIKMVPSHSEEKYTGFVVLYK